MSNNLMNHTGSNLVNLVNNNTKEFFINGVSPEDIEYIKKNYFPVNTSLNDMIFCFKIANHFGLNPILNQIFFIKRTTYSDLYPDGKEEKVTPLIGRDGLFAIINRTGGLKKLTTFCKNEPQLKDGKYDLTKDFTAVCAIERKDGLIVETEVNFFEYAQKTKKGELTSFWKTKPITMLKKVAEVQCLRKAFSGFSGLLIPEEVGVGEVVGNQIIIDTESSTQEDFENNNQPVIQKDLNFIDVTKFLNQIGVYVEIRHDQVVLKNVQQNNHTTIKNFGFRYSQSTREWVASLSNFLPSTVNVYPTIQSLEQNEIHYDFVVKDSASWVKVIQPDKKKLSLLNELGFKPYKDFYIAKIA